METFRNKVVIVTGASGALGSALTFCLAKQGAFLSLAARDIVRLEEAAKRCKDYGAKVLIIKADISQEEQCKQLIDLTVKEYSRIDMLINNAALSKKIIFEDYDDLNEYKRFMDINYYGNVYCTRYALPYLKESKGRIVGICSLLGKVATPGNTAYCASKFAVAAFYDALRYEISRDNVSVTVIYPGFIAEKIDGLKEQQRGLWKKLLGILKMKAEKCADAVLSAAAARKKQAVIPLYSAICVWVNFFAPWLFDRIISIVGKLRSQKTNKS